MQTNPVPTGIAPVPSARSIGLAGKTLNGSTFGTQKRLSSESSNPFVQFADGGFIGDYTQVAMDKNGDSHASWTDFRGNPGNTPANQDVLIANFTP